MKITGEKLRTALRIKGITQQKAADALDISRQAISMWMNLEQLDESVIQRVKEKLDIDLTEGFEEAKVRVLGHEYPQMNAAPYISESHRRVPYYDIEITGSIVRSFSDVKERPAFLVDFPPFNDCDGWLPIVGDSMFPRFQAGEMVAIKQIFNFESILWGEPHLIITNEEHDNLRTIKTIHEHSDTTKIILRASNPQFKGDTIIYKKNILSLYIVKGQAKKSQY